MTITFLLDGGNRVGISFLPMKISASVPDELWARVGGEEPDASPSRIIQRLAQTYLDRVGDHPAPFAEPPPDAEAATRAASAHLVAQARESFQQGYRDALEACQRLAWSRLEDFAGAGFDLERWLEPSRRLADEILAAGGELALTSAEGDLIEVSIAEVTWLEDLAGVLGSLAWPLSNHRKTATFLQGFQAGLRHVWQTVQRGSRAEQAYRRLFEGAESDGLRHAARLAGERWAAEKADLATLRRIASWGELSFSEGRARDGRPTLRMQSDGGEIRFEGWHGYFAEGPVTGPLDPWTMCGHTGLLASEKRLDQAQILLFWSAFRDGAKSIYDAVVALRDQRGSRPDSSVETQDSQPQNNEGGASIE